MWGFFTNRNNKTAKTIAPEDASEEDVISQDSDESDSNSPSRREIDSGREDSSLGASVSSTDSGDDGWEEIDSESVSSSIEREAQDSDQESAPLDQQILSSFAWSEHLAHDLAYAPTIEAQRPTMASEIPIISVLEEDGTKGLYKAYRMSNESSSLIGELLVPENIAPGKTNTLHINFAGTHSAATVGADLEASAGSASFAAYEEHFIQELAYRIRELAPSPPEKLQLVFSGHSLGGAYAQMAFHAVQKALLNNILPLDAVEKMTLGVWSATGIFQSVADESNVFAEQLSKLGVRQRALFALVEGDPVSATGEGSLLSTVNPEFAQVELLKVDAGHGGTKKRLALGATTAVAAATIGAIALPVVLGAGYLTANNAAKAHTRINFNGQEDLAKFQYFNNQNPQDLQKIAKKLNNKSRFMNMQARHLGFVARAAFTGLTAVTGAVSPANERPEAMSFDKAPRVEGEAVAGVDLGLQLIDDYEQKPSKVSAPVVPAKKPKRTR